MTDTAKPTFVRCPHCPQRYGSDTSLQAHVNDHRAKFIQELVPAEQRAVLDPRAHHEKLKAILKRAGRPRGDS